jgi:hypothetical protein
MPKRSNPTNPGPPPALADYIAAFCDAPTTRKASLDLSTLLARVVGSQLLAALPDTPIEVGHRAFGGSVRRHHLDIFVANQHYGLQLGVDVKGLNSGSSVGKNWNNRVGDLHELATNHHQHSPKAVMGGVLAIPFEELTPGTLRNIERAMLNLGGRRSYANAVNLLEGVALMVISKVDRCLLEDIPAPNGVLRIETFASTMAEIFRFRW